MTKSFRRTGNTWIRAEKVIHIHGAIAPSLRTIFDIFYVHEHINGLTNSYRIFPIVYTVTSEKNEIKELTGGVAVSIW
jgi:hypothetical protein